ncbi:MAG: ABC transporter permease [Chlamydiia bacterium]|nr:ABC transporter permease [Chlamydiia bacterium]
MGIVILLLVVFLAALGPSISGHSYTETHLEKVNQAPSANFWLGTDDLGRDVFTRLCVGARISIFIGVMAALIDMIIGSLWGGTAALLGGWIDAVMMRICDLLYSLPYLLIVILLMMVLGKGIIPILVAMCCLGWITMARIVRLQLLQLKQRSFVLAAKGMGAGFFRILFCHLLPNAVAPILVTMTMTIPAAMFVEAFLSFLGLGVQAPLPSWGSMVSEGLPTAAYYPWRFFSPALVMIMTILAFHFVADALKSKEGVWESC